MITVTQLLGYLLYRVNYTHDKAVAEVGKKLFDQESVDREVTLDEALYMLSTYRLGRSAYTSLRHDLMQKVDLPAHYKLMQHKNMIMPSVTSPIGVSGVSVNLCESVRIHFQRLIGILGLQPGTYRMSAKEGLDGSGRHAIYDQKGTVETHNMILWMWVPLEVSKDLDQDQPSTSQSNVIWTEGTPNSPDAARPILITLGKEDSDLLNKIVPPVDGEIELLHRSGVTVDDYGKVYELKIQFLRSMNDGKMQKLLVGRGGAFCILCSFTKEDAVSVDQIQDGFEMDNVDIDTLKALYESLEVDGEVSKSRGDYEERMGLTQTPITSFNVHTFPILHALLRGLDYCLKIMYKLNAGVTAWRENKEQASRVNKAKERVRAIIKEKTGMIINRPDSVGGGTTTTGNTARKCLFEAKNRQVLIECIPLKVRSDGECDRKVFDEFITNLSVVLRAISSKQIVNTHQLDQLCKETAIKLVHHWPTFRFTPTMHEILAHSAALIHANESKGLGTLSEEPLEHNNKNLRAYRERLARKTMQQANLTDVLTRLWIKSDPIVRSYRRVVQCSFCNGPHNVRSCPQRLEVTSGCVSFEDHLVECIFTTGEGTDQGVHMEYDEDTAISQQSSTHMASGDSI